MSFSPDISAIAGFCSELRRAREFNQVTVKEVESKSKLTRDYIEALENAHWELLPSSFVRGYLSLYADAAGLNREKVLKNFDELMSPPDPGSSAKLIQQRPLLYHPEQIGLTRGKIAASWFAELAGNRVISFLILLLTTFSVVAIVFWQYRTDADAVVVVPTARLAFREYGSRTHGPLTTLAPPAVDTSTVRSSLSPSSARVTSRSACLLRSIVDNRRRAALRMIPYDTVVVQYYDYAELTVFPGKLSSVQVGDSTIAAASIFKDSSFQYLIGEAQGPLPLDSLKSEAGVH